MEWISVEDALPDNTSYVFVTDGKDSYCAAVYYKSDNCWSRNNNDIKFWCEIKPVTKE